MLTNNVVSSLPSVYKALSGFLGLIILSLACLLTATITYPAHAAPAALRIPQFNYQSPAWLVPDVAPLLLQTESIDGLRQQQEQLEQKRANVIKERERLERLEQEALRTLTGLRETIDTTNLQIQDYETQLAKAKAQLKQLETKLAIAEKAFQSRQIATVSRLQFLQRQQGSRGLAILLNSQNMNEFLDRRYQLKLVYRADRQILSELQAEAEAIKTQKFQVEAQKNQIALLNQQLLVRRAQFQAQAQAQEKLVNRLNADRVALEAAEAKLAEDSASLSSLIQQRVAALQARASYGLAYYGTGQMAFPSNAPISSPFGWRMHPILGYERFHGGVDFAADYGSPIQAADSGVVIFAGWYGGYGNAVIIDHGNGITTLYGHASELYVSEGQAVQRGQAIAAVGSTGLSTGPHLHFEVRQNGEPVDPLAFL